jgi:hypothetical protein
MSEHEFFKDFGYKKPKITRKMPEEMEANLFIMEIYNNWDIVKKLMNDHKEGKLNGKQIDMISHYWINNLLENKIDLNEFETPDEFYEKYIK